MERLVNVVDHVVPYGRFQRNVMETETKSVEQIQRSKMTVESNLPIEWVIVGSISGGILLIVTVFAFIYLWRCFRKSDQTDKDEDGSYKTLSYVRRYSSSDTSSSPIDVQLLEDQLRPNLSISHVQPKHSHFQYNLLSVNQPDVSGTSDEEEAQQIANTSGRIWFTVKYNEKCNELLVNVIKARYLRGRGIGHELRDPFVRVFLLPDELHYQQSKARRRTLSPKFNEIFKFTLSPEDVLLRTIKLSLYDIDKKSVRHTLGHALVPLDKVDVTSDAVIWRNLETISQKLNNVGELFFSLCCNPYTDRVKVAILRGKNFLLKRYNCTKDTEMFVRLELYYGPKLLKFKDTMKQKFCENPKFFQNFSFSLGGKRFDSCNIAIVMMATNLELNSSSCDGCESNTSTVSTVSTSTSFAAAKITKVTSETTACGKVVVGSYLFARREELQHWQDMMSNPRQQIERWHFLTEIT